MWGRELWKADGAVTQLAGVWFIPKKPKGQEADGGGLRQPRKWLRLEAVHAIHRHRQCKAVAENVCERKAVWVLGRTLAIRPQHREATGVTQGPGTEAGQVTGRGRAVFALIKRTAAKRVWGLQRIRKRRKEVSCRRLLSSENSSARSPCTSQNRALRLPLPLPPLCLPSWICQKGRWQMGEEEYKRRWGKRRDLPCLSSLTAGVPPVSSLEWAEWEKASILNQV